jgi:hypothetical protein
MNGNSTRFKRIALGLLVAAFAAPAALAADRPDNRAGPLGVGPAVSASALSVRPDDRAGPLGVGQEIASQPSAALRPDDRPGIRGVGSSEPATQSLRPDDRPGPLGVGEIEFVPGSSTDGFDWGDAGIGVVAGLGVAAALAGVLLLAMRRSPHARKTGAAATG